MIYATIMSRPIVAIRNNAEDQQGNKSGTHQPIDGSKSPEERREHHAFSIQSTDSNDSLC